jgi:hypothetical protein
VWVQYSFLPNAARALDSSVFYPGLGVGCQVDIQSDAAPAGPLDSINVLVLQLRSTWRNIVKDPLRPRLRVKQKDSMGTGYDLGLTHNGLGEPNNDYTGHEAA